MTKIQISLVLICASTISAAQKIAPKDVTELFAPSYVFGNECEHDSLVRNELTKKDLLGYIGPDYQRYSIIIDSAKQLINGKYAIYGRSYRFSRICTFILSATESGRTTNKYESKPDGNDIKITLDISGSESGCHDSGIIKGKAEWFLFEPEHAEPFFSSNHGIENCADGYSNLLFTGKWDNPKNGSSRKLRFGYWRIPDSDRLDCGAGEFWPCPDADKFGWKDFRDYYDSCFLENAENTDKCQEIKKKEEWWRSDWNDSLNQNDNYDKIK